MGEVINIAVPVMLLYIPFLFSLCFHEFAHGFVAKLRGDDTAEMMGRLTMNPLAHIDWIRTVAFPIIGMAGGIPWVFGWAKPVPVNPYRLKNPKKDMLWISAAGPLSNIMLALASGLLLRFLFAIEGTPDLHTSRTMGLFIYI